MKTRRIIAASLSMTILFAAAPTAGVCLADDVVTVDAENSASEKYTLKELDFSYVLEVMVLMIYLALQLFIFLPMLLDSLDLADRHSQG